VDAQFSFVLKLLEAAVLGGMIGLERELSGKAAGLRTNLLICLGSALLTDLSLAVASHSAVADPARIAAQIVSGIGFLGAGTILQSRRAVHGLTSAAVIWVVAAVGMTVGAGLHLEAFLATALVLVALSVLRRFEKRLFGERLLTVTLTYETTPPDPEELLRRAGLRRRLVHARHSKEPRQGGTVTVSWRGALADPAALMAAAEGLPGVSVQHWEAEE
jgi:putative Mg2+ transporter-C (MgtC) family protein